MTGFSTNLPDGPRGRALALGLTLALLASLWAGLIDPATRWFAAQADTLQQRHALLRRMEALAASLPTLRQAAAAAPAAAAPALLPEPSDALAAAALQEKLLALAQQTGARITSQEALPAAAAGPYRRIGLRIAVTAAYPMLAAMLRDIADASPPLIIDDLHLQRASALGGPQTIEAGLTITAFRAGQPGPAP